MQLWLANLVIMVLTKLTSTLMTKGLEKLHSKQATDKSETDIDKRLFAFKAAYREAFNGSPVTKEQRQNLNRAIADFLRGDNGGL